MAWLLCSDCPTAFLSFRRKKHISTLPRWTCCHSTIWHCCQNILGCPKLPSFLRNQPKDHSDIPKQIHTVHVSINSKTGRLWSSQKWQSLIWNLIERHWNSREQSPSRYGRVSLRELPKFAYAPSVLSRIEADNHNRISLRLSFSGKLLGSGSNALPVMLLYLLTNPRGAVLS